MMQTVISPVQEREKGKPRGRVVIVSLSYTNQIKTDMEDELDEELFLSEHMNETRGNEGTWHAEVHNFLSAKLQQDKITCLIITFNKKFLTSKSDY